VRPAAEELDSGPSPAPQTAKIVTIAAGHAAHDTYSAFLPPLLPVFIERLSLARAEAGLLTVFLQGPSLLQPVIGHLGDRWDLRLAVILSPAITAVCMSLVGVAPGYGALVLLLVTAGLSAAVLHSVAPVLAGRLSAHRLGYVYMALSFAVRSVVVVLVGGVADWVGMRWTFLVCASLALLGAPFVAWLPGRSGPAASSSRDGDSAQP